MAAIDVDETSWPLVVIRWPAAAITDADIEDFLRRSVQQLGRRQRFGSLHDGVRASGLDTKQRKRMAEHVNAHRRELGEWHVAAAIVADSAVVRGMITAINGSLRGSLPSVPSTGTPVRGPLREHSCLDQLAVAAALPAAPVRGSGGRRGVAARDAASRCELASRERGASVMQRWTLRARREHPARMLASRCRPTLLLFALVVVAGCSSSPGGAADTGALDAGIDATTNVDAAAFDPDTGIDAAVVDAGSDAAACTGVEAPMPRGICDGRGMTGCRIWAEENSGRPGLAYAICIQAGTGGCARADRCTDATDVGTCTCGDGPACAPQETCVSDTASGARYCTCVTRAP